MLAEGLPLGHDSDAIGIDTQAHRPIGKGYRHAATVALQIGDPYAFPTLTELCPYRSLTSSHADDPFCQWRNFRFSSSSPRSIEPFC